MSATLAGRHALVTGASRGIGRAIVTALLNAGANVSMVARSQSSLDEVRNTLSQDKAASIAADITDPVAVTRAVDVARRTFGNITILVNNAGQAQSAPIQRTDTALWQRMFDVNVNGAFHCIQTVLPDMLAEGSGRIVNIASTAALKGYAYVSAYCAAKHAVLGLTRSLALELAQRGVTVNAVCPGYTNTDLVQESIGRIQAKTGRSERDALAALVAANPQGRLIEPGEVAAAVMWLCLPSSASVTGQSIAVAGGEVM